MSARIGILWVLAGRLRSACGANPGEHAGAAPSPDAVNLGKPAWEH